MNIMKSNLRKIPELFREGREIIISMGIVAHNESRLIGKMLSSLFEQSLLNQAIHQLQIELIVMPNGCTDDTAEVARRVIASSVNSLIHKNLRCDVKEISQAGKSNAWNLFVHEFSSRKAQYLFLMDSDIQLLNQDTLHSMLKTIEESQAYVVVDQPIKDVALKPDRTLREHLSAAISGLSGGQSVEGGPAWICGQLYCAKAEVLRQIWLPTALPGEDGFLYAMIVTNSFQTERDPNRVLLAGSASHMFEAYTSIDRLLKHECWLIVASAVNELIFSDLRISGMVGPEAGIYIAEKNSEKPCWLSDLVEAATTHRRWLIPRFILSRRFLSLANKPWHKAVAFLPLTLAAFLTDLYLAIQANQSLHRGTALGYREK